MLQFVIPPLIQQLRHQHRFPGVCQLSALSALNIFEGTKHPTVCLSPLTDKRKLLFTLCYNETVNAIIICGYVAENIIMSAAEEKTLLSFTFNNLELNCATKTVCLCKMKQAWKAQCECPLIANMDPFLDL